MGTHRLGARNDRLVCLISLFFGLEHDQAVAFLAISKPKAFDEPGCLFDLRNELILEPLASLFLRAS